jgi:hypothetical protein
MDRPDTQLFDKKCFADLFIVFHRFHLLTLGASMVLEWSLSGRLFKVNFLAGWLVFQALPQIS